MSDDAARAKKHEQYKKWVEEQKSDPEKLKKFIAKRRQYERHRREDPDSRAKRKTWNSSVRGRISVYRNSAKKKGKAWELSFEEAALILTDNCHYCGIAANPTNGIDRKDNDKGYHLENALSCCSMCNYSMNAYSYEEFLAWIELWHSERKKKK